MAADDLSPTAKLKKLFTSLRLRSIPACRQRHFFCQYDLEFLFGVQPHVAALSEYRDARTDPGAYAWRAIRDRRDRAAYFGPMYWFVAALTAGSGLAQFTGRLNAMPRRDLVIHHADDLLPLEREVGTDPDYRLLRLARLDHQAAVAHGEDRDAIAVVGIRRRADLQRKNAPK